MNTPQLLIHQISASRKCNYVTLKNKILKDNEFQYTVTPSFEFYNYLLTKREKTQYEFHQHKDLIGQLTHS